MPLRVPLIDDVMGLSGSCQSVVREDQKDRDRDARATRSLFVARGGRRGT